MGHACRKLLMLSMAKLVHCWRGCISSCAHCTRSHCLHSPVLRWQRCFFFFPLLYKQQQRQADAAFTNICFGYYFFGWMARLCAEVVWNSNMLLSLNEFRVAFTGFLPIFSVCFLLTPLIDAHSHASKCCCACISRFFYGSHVSRIHYKCFRMRFFFYVSAS